MNFSHRALFLCAAVFFGGCQTPTPPSAADSANAEAKKVDSSYAPALQEPTRPQLDLSSQKPDSLAADPNYWVLDDTDNLNGTRVVRLEISRPVAETVLRKLSEDVKAKGTHEFMGVTVAWYLPPGHFPNANPWASATYDEANGPELKITIYGFTENQWFAMLADKPPANRQLQGEWIDGSESCRYRLFDEGENKFVLQKRYGDGSGEEKEVSLSTEHGHTRLDYLEPGHDDHWLIDDSGNLEQCDNDGMFSIAVKH